MAVILHVVYVCTTHRQTLQDGTWTEEKWKEVMEQRHGLILHEGVCNTCHAECKKAFERQWEARWMIAANQTVALNAANS